MLGARGALLLGAPLLGLLLVATPAAAQDVNLAVTDLSADPSDPVDGDATRFPATVENQGSGTSEPFTVKWILDGSETLDEREVGALGPGEEVTVASRNWTAEAGDHTIRAIADATNRNEETDETDNVLQTTFTVRSPAGPRGPVTVLDATLPTPREGAQVVPLEGRHVVVGGANGTGVDASDPTQLLSFDPVNHTVDPLDAALPTPLREAPTVAAGDQVHVLGGRGPGGLRAAIHTYDPASGNVTTAEATLPSPTCCGAAVWNGTHVLLLGGNTSAGPTDRIVAWEPGANATTTLETALPAPRTRHQVAWDARDLPDAGCPGGCAYVLGGQDADGTPLRSILRYNPESGEVQTVSSQLPEAGAVDAAVAWSGTHAFVVGGEDLPDHLRRIVRYDPIIDDARTRYARLPTGRHALTAAWHDDAAYILGGRDDATLDSILRYEPGQPDLAVGDLRIRPPRPDVGDTVRFAVNLENVGTVPAGNLTVRFRLDGDPAGSTHLDGLDVGRSLQVSSDPWNATAGTHAISVRALLTSSVGEPRHDNNEVEAAFTVNQPPEPAFEVAVDGLNVTADASGTQDPDGTVVNHTWTWGDGRRSWGGPTAAHTYPESGNYTVTLEVRDDGGATVRTSRTVTPNRAPDPSFEVDIVGQSIEVDATPSSDADGDPIVSYLWSWGDNSTLGSGIEANHTYSEIGIYTVTLSVEDVLGGTAISKRDIEIWGPIPGPGLAPAVTAVLLAVAAGARARE